MISDKTIYDLADKARKEAAQIKDETKREEVLRQQEELLKNYQKDDRMVLSTDMKQLLDKDQTPRYKLGVPELDEAIGGNRGGDLVVISGPTGAGKTTFAQHLTLKLLEQGILSCWFSFEVGPEELFEKFEKMGGELPIFYLPMSNRGDNTDWLEERIIEAKLKHPEEPIKAVFVDHLHYIVSMRSRNMSMDIGETMRSLKEMAERLDVMIFLMAHITKARVDSMPTVADLRDSSFISAESDNVIMVYRRGEETPDGYVYGNEVSISLQKNRRGGVGKAFRMVMTDGRLEVIHYEN